MRPFQQTSTQVLPIKEKTLLHVDLGEPINPHFYVCICFDEEYYYLVQFTSNFNSRIRETEKEGLDHSAMVYINFNNYTFLSRETIAWCNQVYLVEHNEFIFSSGFQIQAQTLSDKEYYQILDGVYNSKCVDNRVKRIVNKLL